MLKTLKHSFRMCPLRWQMRAHERRLYSRGLNHMSPDEIDEFLKEWEAKERPLNTRFVRLTTRRLCQQADWWEADIPGRKEQPDYWTKDKVFWNLNQRGIVMARRIIREKRRESIKWYAEVWGPFAPLIWGAIGGLIGALMGVSWAS